MDSIICESLITIIATNHCYHLNHHHHQHQAYSGSPTHLLLAVGEPDYTRPTFISTILNVTATIIANII